MSESTELIHVEIFEKVLGDAKLVNNKKRPQLYIAVLVCPSAKRLLK